MEAIAQRLGISKTTVHYALRNTGRVSDAMRQRVRDVAAELGYRPNLVASSLRSQRSATLGVVVVSFTSSFHAHVLEGIEGVAQEEKHGILLACSSGRPDKERAQVELFLEKGADGLIIAAADPDENREYYRRLLDEGTRLVFVDRHMPGLNVDFVSADNLLGGHLATNHLLEMGRQRIALLTTNSRDRRSTTVQARHSGCLRALQERGLELSVTLGPNVEDKTPEEEFGFDAVREHLTTRGPGSMRFSPCTTVLPTAPSKPSPSEGCACRRTSRSLASTTRTPARISIRRSPPCGSPCVRSARKQLAFSSGGSRSPRRRFRGSVCPSSRPWSSANPRGWRTRNTQNEGGSEECLA
jgi:DNA-binding LacI/PurR family transcriptional regulator